MTTRSIKRKVRHMIKSSDLVFITGVLVIGSTVLMGVILK